MHIELWTHLKCSSDSVAAHWLSCDRRFERKASAITLSLLYPSAAEASAAPGESPATEAPKEKNKNEKKGKLEKGAGDGGEEEKAVDVSRLNMKIGKIVEVST